MVTNKPVIVPATIEHVQALQGRLRHSDIEEIKACSGRDPDYALEQSFHYSVLAWAAVHHEKVITIFGVCRLCLLSDLGVPWLLGSKELEGVGLEVGRQSRHYVGEMKKPFARLENHIDARQRTSIAWLKWCGFTIEKPEPYGVMNLPFSLFWKE